jgi:ATP-dependent protease ClpP protease subunit
MHEIMLYGLIYPHQARTFGAQDGLTDTELREALAEAGGQNVKLRINTKGGSADVGFAMNTLLSQYQGHTIAHIDGMCASAGTMAAFGCDEIQIAENAAVMTHKSHVDLHGVFNSDDLNDIKTQLGNYDKRISTMYANRLGGKPEEWLEKLDGDTYYTAQEAVDAGFADQISKVVSVRLDFDPQLCNGDVPKWVMKRYSEFSNVKDPIDQDDMAENVRQMLAESEVDAILGGL